MPVNYGLEYFKTFISYDPETGLFKWNASIGTKKSGSHAGTVLTACNKKYISIQINKKQYLAHRLAWLFINGEWPADQVDHIDGCGLNNKISNLRSVTRIENSKNTRLNTKNTSGHFGVIFRHGKWIAQIGVNRKTIVIGTFSSKEEAISARKLAEIKYGFHKNHGSIRSL